MASSVATHSSRPGHLTRLGCGHHLTVTAYGRAPGWGAERVNLVSSAPVVAVASASTAGLGNPVYKEAVVLAVEPGETAARSV